MGDGLFSSRMQRLGCLAKHLKGIYNVGFGDYRKSENVLESYDFEWGQYGMLAPLQLVIKDGTVYQLPQSNINMVYYAEFLHQLDQAALTTKVLPPRNEINIVWEYALRDLGGLKLGRKFDR